MSGEIIDDPLERDDPTVVKRMRESMRDTPTGRGLPPIEALGVEMARARKRSDWKLIATILAAISIPGITFGMWIGRQGEKLEDSVEQAEVLTKDARDTRELLGQIRGGIDAIGKDVDRIEKAHEQTAAEVRELRRELDKQGGERRRR